MKSGVLFISPSADDARTLSEMVSMVGISFVHARNLNQARNMLEARTFGAVLTEARLPDGGWLDVIRLVGRVKRRIAVVVTDTLADARFWADVLESGAYDLLPKPFCSGEVQRILANAVDQPPLLSRALPAA
jgi:two-component system response regulator CpxR